MTAAEEFRKQGHAARTKMEKGRRLDKEGQDEFAAALLDWYESGARVSELCREFGLSETHVRNTIRLEKLRRAAAD